MRNEEYNEKEFTPEDERLMKEVIQSDRKKCPYVRGEDPLLDELNMLGMLKPGEEICAIGDKIIDWSNPEDREMMQNFINYLKIEKAQDQAMMQVEMADEEPDPMRVYFNDVAHKMADVPEQFGFKMEAMVCVPDLLDRFGDKISLGFYNHPSINLGDKTEAGITQRCCASLYNCFLAGVCVGYQYDFDETDLTDEFIDSLFEGQVNVGTDILKDYFADSLFHNEEDITKFVGEVFNTWIGNYCPEIKDGEPDLLQVQCGLVAAFQLGISMFLYKKGY